MLSAISIPIPIFLYLQFAVFSIQFSKSAVYKLNKSSGLTFHISTIILSLSWQAGPIFFYFDHRHCLFIYILLSTGLLSILYLLLCLYRIFLVLYSLAQMYFSSVPLPFVNCPWLFDSIFLLSTFLSILSLTISAHGVRTQGVLVRQY